MSTNTPTSTNTNMVNLTTKTVGLDLLIGKPSSAKKVKSEKFQHLGGHVDPNSLTISKRMLSSKEFAAILRLDSQLKTWLHKLALPSFFRRGTFLLPLRLVDTIDTALFSYKEARDNAVNELLDAYPRIIEADKAKLGPEFCATDYPSKDMLKASFYVSYRYVSLETPDKLEDISASIFQREKERVAQMWDSAADNVRNLLRYSLQETLDALLKAIRPDEDGRKKRLSKSVVNNLMDFLAMFDMRNITDDEELAEIVDKCKNILGGKDISNIKKDTELRDQVYTSLNAVKADMTALAVKKPVRKVTLMEEE